MYNFKIVELRDLEIYKIYCVSSTTFDDFQNIFIHYKIRNCECSETKVIIFNYHNVNDYKHDRNILEEILEKQKNDNK